MTRTTIQFGFLMVILAAFFVALPDNAQAATNLVPNEGFETAAASSSLPQGWQAGFIASTNPSTYVYPVPGFNSSKAVRIEINNAQYVAGDSKWLFEDVAVTAGQIYVYSDMYKSNVATDVIVRFNKGACPAQETDCAYENIIPSPAASDWTQAEAQVVVPAGVTSVTAFRVIRGNAASSEAQSWLELDNVSLMLDSGVTITDHVPNFSLEQATIGGALPRGWLFNGYGQNTPVFEYIKNDGHNGNRSVKVTVSDYVSGDAKWSYSVQPVVAGKDYHFSAWYKTNTEPHVVAQYTAADGTISFFGMPQPEPDGTSAWQHYENEFSVPSNVVSVTVFFYLAGNGWVQTDEYRITPYTYTGFSAPMVSLTFDDGAEENVTTALPVLNALGLKSTQCYMSGAIEGTPDQENQINRVRAFFNSGHEICAHSVTHPDLTTLSASNLAYELQHSRDYLQSIVGVPVTNFASPFGSYNAEVVAATKQYFTSHRTVDEGYNSVDNLDPYRLKVQNMGASTTLAEFQEWVNKAKADKLWLIIVYHKVTAGTPAEFDTASADFEQQMQWLAGAGVSVKRYDEALASIGGGPAVVVPPVITISPFATTTTNQNVTVFATTSKGTLNATQHTFTENGSFTFTATDSQGNTASKVVTVNHINKGVPVITVAPFATTPTNQNVTVFATTTKGTLNATQHTFTENGSFTFTATDSLGNTASKVVTINHIDRGQPVITINPFATIPTNQNVTIVATTNKGTLNANQHTFTENGSFTFTATDSLGNTASSTVTITHIDKEKPVITLVGANPYGLVVGAAYNELGAQATDNVSGNLTGQLVINSSAVVTTTTGTYQVLYSVTDAAGNTATTSRAVVIVPKTLTITAQAGSKVYGAADPILTYQITNGTLVGSDTVTGNVTRDPGENVGVYAIKVGTVSAGPNYAISFEEAIFTITAPACGLGEVFSGTACVKTPSSGGSNSGGGGGSGGGTRPPAVTPPAPPIPPGSVLGTSTPGAPSLPAFIFTRNLKLGMKGSDVLQLQERMIKEGVYSGPATGYFGPMTANAVKAYQRKVGITPTGLVGELTRKQLNNLPPRSTNERHTSLWAQIAQLQSQLKALLAVRGR